MADINKDICEASIQSVFRQLGMAEAVITQHGEHGPNTHNRGSTPIDGIFLPTQLIPEIKSGYLALREGVPSDHRVVWIDLLIMALRWFQIPAPVPLKAQAKVEMRGSENSPEIQCHTSRNNDNPKHFQMIRRTVQECPQPVANAKTTKRI